MVLASGSYFVLSPIPHEIVVGLVVFAALYFVLSKVLLPKLDAVYTERHDRIDGTLERAEQARAEARRADQEYRTRIGEAREEAARIRDAAREEGRRHSEEVLAAAREESSQLVAEGRGELDEERSRLRTDLQPDIARLSRDLAGRILGRQVGEDEYRETVDSYLAQRA
ncbi:F0F1 ATP synthase subunit B [Actinomycetospora soli]|uniref:F0F1 ATP synthase subunit B n=1 Tax=Actinomycetospora soli TaxID=2893887 RepID=UPI001E29B7E9|nr:F0F1 ATP synthase subunit B [Actinomycetospora soli]MCD2190158.1 F0F1 ATP synthase subunit B [Actinomycetospora soli]